MPIINYKYYVSERDKNNLVRPLKIFKLKNYKMQ